MNNYPCVFIPGFGQSKAYLTDGGERKKVWPLNTDVKKAAKEIAPVYLKTVLLRKDAGFTDVAYKLFCEVFEPFASDKDGNARHGIDAQGLNVPLSEYPESARSFVHKIAPLKYLSENTGDENIYCFSYNAFDASFDTAAKLDRFISEIKEKTGAEKVNLLCFSMGGSVAAAYLYDYGEKNDIGKAVFVSSCLGGSAIQDSIVNNDIDKNNGYSLLGFISGNSAVKTFKRVLSLTTWDVRYRLLYRSLDAVKDTLLNTSPGMWGMLSPDVSEEQKKKLLSGDDSAILRQKVDRINEINRAIPSMLKKAEQRGCGIYIIAGYGRRIMELCADGGLNTDGILAVTSSAPGVTAANLGEKLEFGNCLSPDGMLDASTCLFPDRTWFFSGVSHGRISNNEAAEKLVSEIISEESTDVYSSKSAGRFN